MIGDWRNITGPMANMDYYWEGRKKAVHFNAVIFCCDSTYLPRVSVIHSSSRVGRSFRVGLGFPEVPLSYRVMVMMLYVVEHRVFNC